MKEDFTTFKVNSTLNLVLLLLKRRKQVVWRQKERTTKTCIEEGEAKRKEGGKKDEARSRVKGGLCVFVEHLNLGEHNNR